MALCSHAHEGREVTTNQETVNELIETIDAAKRAIEDDPLTEPITFEWLLAETGAHPATLATAIERNGNLRDAMRMDGSFYDIGDYFVVDSEECAIARRAAVENERELYQAQLKAGWLPIRIDPESGRRVA